MGTLDGPSQYAARLAGLATPGVMQQVARAAAGLRAAEIGPEREWTREYGRFHPGSDPWAVVVVVSGRQIDVPGAEVRLVLGFAAEGAADLTHPTTGPFTVRRFPEDEDLPALAAVLGTLTDPRIVRYRPGRRCTMRGSTHRGERFVKLVRDPAPELQRDAASLWDARQRGEISFGVAEPFGWDSERRALWQGVVPGADASNIAFGPMGAALCERMGAALGELASSGIEPARLAPASDQRDRTHRALRRVAERIPSLADRVAAVGEAIDARHEHLRPRPLVPTHGSAHVHQWLVDDDGALGLIDFDRFALGEPELDIATFAAELDSEGSLALPVEDLEHALRAGYESVADPLDPERVKLYRTEKRVAKVARTAWAIRADYAESAERHLRSVETDLALG